MMSIRMTTSDFFNSRLTDYQAFSKSIHVSIANFCAQQSHIGTDTIKDFVDWYCLNTLNFFTDVEAYWSTLEEDVLHVNISLKGENPDLLN